MGQFILTEEISSLDYNFEPYAGKGTIPEPSVLQIQAFRKALSALLVEADTDAAVNTDDMPREQFVKTMEAYLGRDTTEIDEKTLHLVADVCSNQPSFDDLSTLPYRARQAFLGWVVGMLLLPEVPKPATKN